MQELPKYSHEPVVSTLIAPDIDHIPNPFFRHEPQSLYALKQET